MVKNRNIRLTETSTGVIMDQTSITVPDMSLTVQEILRHHVRTHGMNIKPTDYDPTGIMSEYGRKTPLQRAEMAQKNIEEIIRLKQLQAEEQQAIAIRAKQAKRSESEISEKAKASKNDASNG